MDLKIKKCELKDLDALCQIGRDTFITAFEHLNDPVDFQNYLEAAFSKTQIRIELLEPNSDFYLVFSDKNVVGYFKLNFEEAQTDIKDPESCELERIYVHANGQGKGYGTRMLFKALELARKRNKKYLWLGVWQKNIDAIRFYERHGFVKIGIHPYYIGRDKQTDWLMRIDLLPS